jgi:hypothetical protein
MTFALPPAAPHPLSDLPLTVSQHCELFETEMGDLAQRIVPVIKAGAPRSASD